MRFDISQLSFRNLKTEIKEASQKYDMSLYMCPTARNTPCTWKGPLACLFEHFNDEHKNKILKTNVYILEFSYSTLISSCVIVRGPQANYLFKLVSHIDGYLYFYLANIEFCALESYTIHIVGFDKNDIELFIKSTTVRLAGDYTARYEKIHVESLFKIFDNPEKVYLKVVFN